MLRASKGLASAALLLLSFLAMAPEPAAAGGIEVRSGTVDVGDGELFYERAGSGATIVLIHDGLVHREIWDGQFLRLAAHYDVLRYDRRGYGRSPMPGGPFSNLEDLHLLLEGLAIERATLFGMSAGGGLAIDYALEHPEKVEALVVVGAVVSGFDYTDHFFSRGGRMDRSILADPEALKRYFVEEDPYEVAPGNEDARRRIRELLDANPSNLDLSRNRLRREAHGPALPRLGEIDVPVLVVVGEHDIPDVHHHAGAIAAGIPGARREVIRGAGHLVPLERPEAFYRAALGFLMGRDLVALLDEGRIAEAAAMFRRIEQVEPGLPLVGENDLNARGYRSLQAGRIEEALALFRLNVLAHPDSWNVHDSLGEALARSGDGEAALASYRRSLELNPGSRSGLAAIELLERRAAPIPALSGPYLGQEPPGGRPEPFAPGVVSTTAREHSAATFSEKGTTLLFTRQEFGAHDILISEESGGRWTRPEPVPFSSAQLDDGASFLPGGRRLCFGSRRPNTRGGEPSPDTDLWCVDRTEEGWGEPQRLDAPLNTAANESFPAFAADGTMYFHSDRPGGHGEMDLYRSRWIDGRWSEPENLGGPVNTGAGEAAPFVAPDGSYLLFARMGEGPGSDLRIAFRETDGRWSEPQSLAATLGLQSTDLVMAKASPDGRYLFFLDGGDIHWVDAAVIDRLRER